MEEFVLNSTPRRTSNNFGINDIKLNDLTLPVEFDEFNNIKFDNNSSKINFKKGEFKTNFKYGVSKKLENMKTENSYVLDINSKVNKTVKLSYEFDNANCKLHDKLLINSKESTNATVIIKYTTSNEEVSAFHNLTLKTIANKNSNLNVIILNFMNIASRNFVSIDNEILENANVKFIIVDFGGISSITSYYSNLKEKSSLNDVQVIYLGSNNQLFDLNYISELEGENSNINIEVQGALNDTSKKHFKGTIDFKKGAKKSIGNENDSCTLLSDKSRSISLPMLLCSEEDVEGNHSSSAGKILQSELFYLMSRGFSDIEAKKLLLKAKFSNVIDCIKDEELKEEILKKIDDKIN